MHITDVHTAFNGFVITGGPGAGKSSLIAALAAAGYATAPESGRAIIQDQLASGGRALPWIDAPLYAEEMLTRDIASYERLKETPGTVFLDRGLVDLIGYARLSGFPVSPALRHAVQTRRYNPVVFIAPPWEAIYVTDAERKQTFAEAQATFGKIREGYGETGYALMPLPLAGVEARVEFVLDAISRLRQA